MLIPSSLVLMLFVQCSKGIVHGVYLLWGKFDVVFRDVNSAEKSIHHLLKFHQHIPNVFMVIGALDTNVDIVLEFCIQLIVINDLDLFDIVHRVISWLLFLVEKDCNGALWRTCRQYFASFAIHIDFNTCKRHSLSQSLARPFGFTSILSVGPSRKSGPAAYERYRDFCIRRNRDELREWKQRRTISVVLSIDSSDMAVQVSLCGGQRIQRWRKLQSSHHLARNDWDDVAFHREINLINLSMHDVLTNDGKAGLSIAPKWTRPCRSCS